MPQILASGKTGSTKYDLRSVNPNKVFPRLDARQLGQSFQKLYEVVRGFCLSGNEGSTDALDDDLSIITTSNIADYSSDLVQGIQTLVSHGNLLEVDGSSTANALILNTVKISSDIAPDGNDYTVEAPLPFKWQDELRFRFRATATNTGAMTASIPELAGLSGSIEMLDEDGAALARGDVVLNKYYTVVTKTIASVKKLILLSKSTSNLSDKNLIINGSFGIWQRGTSVTSGYGADRWSIATGGSPGACTVSRGVFSVGQTDVPGNPVYYLRWQQTTGSGADSPSLHQPIEGVNNLAGGRASVSFYAKVASGTLLCTPKLTQYFGTGGSTGVENLGSAVTVTTSWKKFELTIDVASIAGKTIGGGNFLEFILVFPSGATFDLQLAKCQVEEGGSCTPFVERTETEELLLCRRYYEKSYEFETEPGVITPYGQNAYTNISGTSSQNSVRFRVSKRIPPTVTIYSPVTGVAGKLHGAGVDKDAILNDISRDLFNVRVASFTPSAEVYYHWIADSEL